MLSAVVRIVASVALLCALLFAFAPQGALAQDVPEKDKFCHNRVVSDGLADSAQCVSTCHAPNQMHSADGLCFNGLVCCYAPSAAADVPEKDKFCHNRVVSDGLASSAQCVSACSPPGRPYPFSADDPACFNGLTCCYTPVDSEETGCLQAAQDNGFTQAGCVVSDQCLPPVFEPISDDLYPEPLCPAEQVCCARLSSQTDTASGETPTPAQPGKPITLPDPLGGVTVPRFFGNVIRVFSSVAGAIALLMFVYGGIMWILSAGEASKVKAAQKILVNSTIGIILIFGAYLFTSAILSSLIGASAIPTP